MSWEEKKRHAFKIIIEDKTKETMVHKEKSKNGNQNKKA